MNISQKLFAAGQSVWYDNIQRRLLRNGELARMIANGEIRGVTSNPTIFKNAISKSNDYDESLVPYARQGLTSEEIYYKLAIEDIEAVADLFKPLYIESAGGDGYVSLEVSPYKAHDTAATIEETIRLWHQLKRPNLMIKIPATKSGLPAITAGIAEGVNVNVTLIFSRERYAEVVDAYLTGLEKRVAMGQPIDSIASVASLFVSRIDSNVDAQLEKIAGSGGPRAAKAAALMGKAGIANACLVYDDFKRLFASERFEKLRARGARLQRPLWASTSTKNPNYRDVMYVEDLVAPHTVDTVPPQTLVALLDHAVVQPGKLEAQLETARQTLADLKALGISFAAVTQQVEDDGVKIFADSYTDVLATMEQRREESMAR